MKGRNALMQKTSTGARATRVGVAFYEEKSIYHSPETPGHTCWVGLWRLPDGRLRCSFLQITGSADRPVYSHPVLESGDGGGTWAHISDGGPSRHTVALRDGTMVSAVWNNEPDGTAYLRRSTDEGRTWGEKIYFVSPDEYRAWPGVIRQLGDGRLVLMAGCWNRSDRYPETPCRRMAKMMFVSDDQGKTWSRPIELMSVEDGVCEESDFCELPNGDLFWVHRVEHYPDEGSRCGSSSSCFPDGRESAQSLLVRRKNAEHNAQGGRTHSFRGRCSGLRSATVDTRASCTRTTD